MLTSIRSLLAATVLAGGLLVAAPAMADDEESKSGLSVAGNVAIVSDYRFRGISLSLGDPAIQGGITITHSSGFYVGTWSSSIDGGALYGEQELDLFGGWGGTLGGGVNLDVGLLKYIYPTNDTGPADYWEPYASISGSLGPVTAKLGVAYAWEQDSLGGGDNLYIYNNYDVGIPTTPITVSAHIGYTDGALSPSLLTGGTKGNGWDYSIGASFTVLGNLTAGVSYVGVDGASIDGLSDDTVVGTLTLSL